jgi:hypothetical protein
MDLLRNLFGNLTSGIIRLAVTAGILFLAYLFIVKPVLKTTSDAIKTSNETIQKSLGVNGLDDIGGTIKSVNVQIQRQIRESFKTAKHTGNPKRLIRCIKRSNGDVDRIQRCTRKF